MKILELKLSQTPIFNIALDIKDYSEMSCFIDIFQGLHLFYREFQGPFFTKNL